MKQLLLLMVLCGAATVMSQAQPAAPDARRSTATHTEREKPPVKVQESPGAPLRVAKWETKWATPEQNGLEVYSTVENSGTKPIRAYAVRILSTEEPSSNGCFINNIQKPGKILQPKQSVGFTTFRGVRANTVIEIGVDFVEFTDGSVWGEDTCQTAESLDGSRAGGRAAKKYLKQALAEHGPEAFISKLKDGDFEMEPLHQRSKLWKENFRAGTEAVQREILTAYEDGGYPEIEPALNKPFDAADNH